MISIKRLLDQKDRSGDAIEPDRDEVEALKQMCHLLLNGCASHIVRGRESDCYSLRQTLRGLARQMEESQSATSLLSMSNDAVEALESYGQRTNKYLRDENEQMHAMVTMLADTVGELAGQTDASVARLHAIEEDLGLASGLEDIRAVRSNLENCLRALREAGAQQRRSSGTIAQRLRDNIAMVQQGAPPDPKDQPSEIDLFEACWGGSTSMQSATTQYVAAFKLQRAEQIASRFGESATQQMLSALGTQLKNALGPADRLLPWKGTSIVMLIQTMSSMAEVRAQLAKAVIKVGMQSIDVGGKSALLAVRVDWALFPPSDMPSLDAAITVVDAFLSNRQSPVLNTTPRSVAG
jgi:hypothetical protein